MFISEKDKSKEKLEAESAQQANIQMLRTRSILLTGEINKELSEKIIRQLILMEADDESQAIKIFIDSPGGDADAGFAIFDMIRFVKAPVHIIGMGLVASAAAIILLAVPLKRRVALPNSHFLIHQPLSGIKGVATAIEIHAKEVEKLRHKINELIASESKTTLKKVIKDTDRDFWMDAKEAQSYGLVAKIIRERDELSIN